MGEIHELFVVALSLVWFAGATPEQQGTQIGKKNGRNRNKSEQIDRNNRKGGTASLRLGTCVKRNAVFGARFKGLSLYFLYQKGNLIRIKTGLDAYLISIQTRTPLSWYPPSDYSKLSTPRCAWVWPVPLRGPSPIHPRRPLPKH